MKTNHTQNTFFRIEAKERLIDIYPEDGPDRFARLEKFVSIAVKHKGKSLVVPPELDMDLHEVLAARDSEGNGFEVNPLRHVVMTHVLKRGFDTRGKKLSDLSFPEAHETKEILDKEGFVLSRDACYSQPACTLTILS